MGDGTDLIRVGKPLRPEFAAWRYGRGNSSRDGPAAYFAPLGGAGLLAAPPVLSAMFGPLAPLAVAGAAAVAAWRLARKPAFRRECLPLRGPAALREPGGECAAHFGPHVGRGMGRPGRSPRRRGLSRGGLCVAGCAATWPSSAASRHAPSPHSCCPASILPEARCSRWPRPCAGSTPLEGRRKHSRASRIRGHVRPTLDLNKATFSTMHPAVRLALEMAVHEDEERRLLRGELSALEVAWRREERLAAIADRLAIPGSPAATARTCCDGI